MIVGCQISALESVMKTRKNRKKTSNKNEMGKDENRERVMIFNDVWFMDDKKPVELK